jgi:hypothetical protein
MYTVEYGYYSYPRKTKTFDNYTAAKIFFYSIVKQKGVNRAELKVGADQ